MAPEPESARESVADVNAALRNSLAEAYQRYCVDQGLPAMDAEELLFSD